MMRPLNTILVFWLSLITVRVLANPPEGSGPETGARYEGVGLVHDPQEMPGLTG